MTPVDIIAVPYDSGRRRYRMGAGPEALLEGGLTDALRGSGHDVRVAVLESATAGQSPLESALELGAAIASEVRRARERGRFPLVLAGNCVHTAGAFAAVNGPGPALAWFDAHGDLNTPETSTTGFLDGMSLAMMLGWCHRDVMARLAGFTPVGPERVLLIGARDLDPPEVAAAAKTPLAILTPEAAGKEDERVRAFEALLSSLACVYLHIDLDVLDPAECGPANVFAAPGGLSVAQAVGAVRDLGSRRPIAGITLSALDPAVDTSGRVRAAAVTLAVAALSLLNPGSGLPGPLARREQSG